METGDFFFFTTTNAEKKYLKGLPFFSGGPYVSRVTESSQCALARPGRERFWARGARKRLAGREKAFSREPARLVHALVGQAVIRVVGNEGRPADARVVSGRGRGRAGACPGSVGWLGGWLQRRRGAVGVRELGRWGSWGGRAPLGARQLG